MTIIGAILAFLFLEPPWRYVAIGALLLFDAVEIAIWLQWRKQKPITGAEAVVGASGTALTDCRPDGQVKVRGQIWKAYSPEGAAAGDSITVTAVDGIRLEVARR